MTAGVAFRRVRLAAPSALLPEIADFYGRLLGRPAEQPEPSLVAVRVGETVMEFEAAAGSPFYHFALLVPGRPF